MYCDRTLMPKTPATCRALKQACIPCRHGWGVLSVKLQPGAQPLDYELEYTGDSGKQGSPTLTADLPPHLPPSSIHTVRVLERCRPQGSAGKFHSPPRLLAEWAMGDSSDSQGSVVEVEVVTPEGCTTGVGRPTGGEVQAAQAQVGRALLQVGRSVKSVSRSSPELGNVWSGGARQENCCCVCLLL